MLPDKDQALQFAIMLQAGLPAAEAIRYFTDDTDASLLAQMTAKWSNCAVVRKATAQLMGKSWTEMSLDERIKYALEQHYSALAYLLFSTNYLNANAGEKAKIDTARVALEAKQAGMAGKGDALSRFFDDLNSGKLTLKPTKVALN